MKLLLPSQPIPHEKLLRKKLGREKVSDSKPITPAETLQFCNDLDLWLAEIMSNPETFLNQQVLLQQQLDFKHCDPWHSFYWEMCNVGFHCFAAVVSSYKAFLQNPLGTANVLIPHI